MKTKVVRLAVHFPGQAVKRGLDVYSLKGDSALVPVLEKVYETFAGVVSDKFRTDPKAILNAGDEALKENTFFAQLRSFYEAMSFWMVLMKGSFNSEPPLEDMVSEQTVLMQLAGHSLGGATAKYAPGPGPLEEQLSNIRVGTESIGNRAIPMLDTPHTYDVGGMAAITGLRGWQVNKILKRVNKSLEHGVPLLVTNNNAPKIKLVAGTREGLNRVGPLVNIAGGKFWDEISNYWFHHTIMQQAGLRYWHYLGMDGALGNTCPLFRYVSYVSGSEIPPSRFRQDLADGVWKPVQYYTFRGPSVHGATHKNHFYNVVVFTQEGLSWLRDSKWIRPHLVRDLKSLAEFKGELMQIINGEVAEGKLRVAQPQQKLVPAYQA